MLNRLLCVLIGYACGSVQNAWIIGKVGYKLDIRDYGSGNAGATNVMRVLGTRIGILTLALDVLKGIIAVIIPSLLYGYGAKHLLLWTGIGVVLGHNYPFYLGFRGGKGVAATLGVFAAADFRILFFAGVPALVLLYFTRYMSLASLTYMTLMPIVTAILYIGKPHGVEILLLTLVFTISAFWRHRSNIVRLFKGQEHKIGQKDPAGSPKDPADSRNDPKDNQKDTAGSRNDASGKKEIS